MGSYNSCYERYYKNIKKGKCISKKNFINNDISINNKRYYDYELYRNKKVRRFSKAYMQKILIRHLFGTFCLLIISISFKLNVTPNSEKIYKTIKKEIQKEYGVNDFLNGVRSLDYELVGDCINREIDKIKELDIKERLDFFSIEP
ncbi:hypothetical protein HAHI6034_02390 [Hathewaya histolytica]|uniref:Uncharacterized protein n=1 Tax=Hathewaya histolytica TaxID=1498 RepID=A0A4U9RJT8_HATHI|nr:hypothetical protein [Hathewaya histolytica]VTQ90853.1 Uncharacterised protein [Hathewaya histolytica]